MKKLNSLFCFLIALCAFTACSSDDNQTAAVTAPFVDFEITCSDVQVSLSWKNPSNYAYTVYAANNGKDFTVKGSNIRSDRFVDNVVNATDGTTLTYRLVPSSQGVNDAQAVAKQKTITLVLLSDNELLDRVQRNTLKYFYDFAHPDCKLARERSNIPADLDVVTTGGTGFGVMSLIVGAERNFISRQQAFTHIRSITDFLQKVERFHGAYAHWYFGSTGKVKPFSDKDNGGDLVETALLMQGMLTAKEYFDTPWANADEKKLVADIDKIWREIEWSWYTKGENKLYWHWSKQHDFAMNMGISGWNEGLIPYVLAASSPTYPISKEVYMNGYANNGGFKNGKSYYGITLPLGNDSEMGGPLFFAHYSFLGLNPTGLSDQYCSDYFEQNRNHVLINRAYCIENPKKHIGYSKDFWGLTASDCPANEWGYLAHAPGHNDNGTISPTAALASMPYAPQECMDVLKFLYRNFGDRIEGEYGLYDAINLGVAKEKQIYKSHLAIDQGPIVVMIENHRSKLIWNTFMKNQDVLNGLQILGFSRK